MTSQPGTPGAPDLGELAKNLDAVAALARDVVSRWGAARPDGEEGPPDLASAFGLFTAESLAGTAGTLGSQLEHWGAFLRLWQNVAERSLDPSVEPLARPQPGDRRFRDPNWDRNPVFDLIKQQYLLANDWIEDQLRELAAVDAATAQRVAFYTRQFVNALAPTNFLLTNPEALRATLDTNGENLVRGLANLLADIERGDGRLRVRTSDTEAFTVGEDLAITPGTVVFQNELMQLIQYAPSTERVYRRPLLIVPPWINKYYVLDLRPENSFVRWAVDRGYTVFMISWVNPDAQYREKTFEDYMVAGPLAALDAIEEATGEQAVSALGYCIGGTLLSMTLAHLGAREEQARVTSCTLLAAQVDFSESGELAVFATEAQIEALERRMERNGGYLDADAMATTFNLLRANDLIWSYVVSNYLLGREPPPFDLLYWNADATRMPAPMQSYYLRNMYLRNALIEPGALELGGTKIDLTRIEQPAYLLSAREDHIAPWRSVFKLTHHLGGPVRFVLSGSGHIAGIVNPPANEKYGYVVGEPSQRHATSEGWLATAEEHAGSWWSDWDAWLAPKSGALIDARQPAAAALEAAPGSYVLVRS